MNTQFPFDSERKRARRLCGAMIQDDLGGFGPSRLDPIDQVILVGMGRQRFNGIDLSANRNRLMKNPERAFRFPVIL